MSAVVEIARKCKQLVTRGRRRGDIAEELAAAQRARLEASAVRLPSLHSWSGVVLPLSNGLSRWDSDLIHMTRQPAAERKRARHRERNLQCH
jgi:hypothetical protein